MTISLYVKNKMFHRELLLSSVCSDVRRFRLMNECRVFKCDGYFWPTMSVFMPAVRSSQVLGC